MRNLDPARNTPDGIERKRTSLAGKQVQEIWLLAATPSCAAPAPSARATLLAGFRSFGALGRRLPGS
jgi:hypothetical protein